MADYRLKDLRGPSRRHFLKWIGAAGAAIGLERSKVLNVLSDSGGVALADMCAPANRSVHLIGANGSLAWFQLLWPHIDVATTTNPSQQASFAYHSYGTPGTLYTPPASSGNPFYYSPQAPWMANGMPTRPVTAFMAGKDETHKPTPTSANAVGVNASMLAACGAIQAQSLSALVPMIGLVPFELGDAVGVPAVATVSNAAGMVGLFNSEASTNALALQADKDLFDAYYKAYLGLRYAANLPTSTAQIANAKSAAKLLGFNYGAQLAPTGPGAGTDTARYGLDALNASGNATQKQKDGFTALGMALIVTAKALKIGLTNSVVLGVSPGPTSDTSFTDPHITFSGSGGSVTAGALDALTALGVMLNAFYADLATGMDPACSQTLDKSVILTVHGDTPHNPLISSAWPDATPNASNWLYVMGNGYIKSGWFGGVRADGSCDSFNPSTGATISGGSTPYGGQDMAVRTYAAGAAVTYAVAKGVANTVAPFYSGTTPYKGIVV